MALSKQLPGFIVILMLSPFFLFCSKTEEGLETLPPEEDISDTLVFTANESFFSPVGTLRANQRDKTSGNEYNKLEYYDFIYEWKELGDTILFGIETTTNGSLSIRPEMGIPVSQDGSSLYIYLGNERKELNVHETGSEENYVLQDEVVFEDVKPGFHVLKLQLKSLADGSSSVGRLSKVQLSGTAANNAKTVMRRYRPFAIHCSWGTESSNPVEISVHEVSVENTTVNSYQPITTPFGYTGSPWSLKTATFSGYNFSLWSYGANDPVPPFYQESHLVAVGAGLTFGAYGHEGTGVKPRGDHPYIGIDTNTMTVAVRKVPGEIYDTYWSYYLDPTDGHWKLYGCGKKFNKSGKIEGLKTGAFVEVAGPATKERSGHELRESQYRGWQMDTSGEWYPVNTMKGTTKHNELSYRAWGIKGNRFFMCMGGWGEPGTAAGTFTLSNPDPVPPYLKGSYLDELYAMPATFTHNEPVEITSGSATLSFDITDLGTNASAKLFWGTQEGLTKEDKWAMQMSIPVKKGNNTVSLNELDPSTPYYYRLVITNDQGITWSFDTQQFTTL